MINQGRGTVDLLLADSFKELACRQPVEKITIKEITDKAGVIRPTFYNHFQDKYELLEWIIHKDVIDPTRPLILNGMIDQALVLIFASMERDKEFYCKAAKLEGQNSFENIARKCIQELIKEILGENFEVKTKRSSWLTGEHLAEYYAQSLCYVVMSWIKSGMSINAKEMADIYMYIMRHSIEDVLKDI